MKEHETIYFYHMMKTGGKGILSSYLRFITDYKSKYTFLDINGMEQCGLLEKHINDQFNIDNQIDINQLSKIHWGPKVRNKCFNHSHQPYHETKKIPKETITFTCVRNPLERLISHYNMLLTFKQNNTYKPDVQSDNYEYVKDFEYFINNFPKKFLIHQLYFFSKTGDVSEAFDNITKCTQILLLDRLQDGFDRLYNKTGIELKETKNINKNPIKNELQNEQIKQFKNILKPEYEFYKMILEYYEREQ